MPVSQQTPYTNYTGNGVTTVFAYAFKLLSADDLTVKLNDVVQPSGYTVAGIGNDAGGTVTFFTPPGNGISISLLSEVQLERTTDYQDNGDLLAQTQDDDFDRIWLALQSIGGNLGGAIRVPFPEQVAPLPTAANRRDRLLAFDPATGKPELSDFTSTQVASAIAAAYGTGSTLDALTFVQAGVGAVPLTAQDKMRERVSAKDYGAIADGNLHPLSERFASLALAQANYPFVTSLAQQIDWAASQAGSNYAHANGKALGMPAGLYMFGNDSVVLTQVVTDSYQIIGDGCGDAYGITTQAATIIKTNGVDAFRMVTPFPTSAVSIKGIKFLGDELIKTGFLLNMTEVSRQLKNVWLTEVIGTFVGGLVKAFSTTATNLPYLTINKAYTWGCDKIIYLDNVPTTIFTIRDSLFHSCQNYGLHLGLGAELSISDSWFESCNPAAIYKPTTNFLKLALHNVYFENNTPAIPTRTSMVFGANTDITLTGKTNLPGSFMPDNPFSLGFRCSLANYTTELVTIRGIGGLVKTPGTVRPHHLFESQLHIPYGAATPANSGDFLLGNTIAGELSAVAFAASSMPAHILKDYCPTRTVEVCRSNALVSPGAYASAGVLCAAFVYQSNNINNGLGTTANFVTSAGTVQLDKSFSFPEESLDAPHFCVITIPLAAGVTPTGVFIEGRANKWASYASVFSMVLDDQTLENMLPLQGRIRKVTQTIANGGSFTFVAQDRAAKAYNVTSETVINGGNDGLLRVASYGTTTNGSKTRETGGTVAAGVTVTPGDGANGDMLSIAVNNASGSSVVAEFTWRY